MITATIAASAACEQTKREKGEDNKRAKGRSQYVMYDYYSPHVWVCMCIHVPYMK